MTSKKSIIIIFIALACISMYLIESYIKPMYVIKSIYKIILFAGLPLIYCAIDKEVSFKEYLSIQDKRQIKLL